VDLNYNTGITFFQVLEEKNSNRKSSSLRHVQLHGLGEGDLHGAFLGLKVPVKYNTLSHLPFSSPGHQSCTCLEHYSISGFFSFLPQVVRALHQTSGWSVTRTQAPV